MKYFSHYAGMLFLIIAGSFSVSIGQTQGLNIAVDAQGISLVGNSYADIKGSPFLYDNWVKSTVKLANETVYNNIDVKYEQVMDIPVFLAANDVVQAFAEPVAEFTLGLPQPITFSNGFEPIDGATAKSYYEVLVKDKIMLLKRTVKRIVEERGAGSINVSKQFQELSKYYLKTPQGMIKIKKDKNDILNVLKDKAAQLDGYIQAEKLKVKNDSDLIKLVAYYNTLK